ncbi:hypothetical protein BH20ACI1_BH20ACI1_07070 [soil metagenome]
MIRKNSRFLRGMALGLTIVAVIAIVVALVVGYRKNGEINFLLIGLAAVVLTANLLAIRKSKTKSGD